MKVTIVEKKENLKNPENVKILREVAMSIFNQGHDVMLITKESVPEHLNANIFLAEEENFSLQDFSLSLIDPLREGGLIPEFLGLVSNLETDSLARSHNSQINKFKREIPMGWYAINPSWVKTKEGVVDWGKVFKIVVDHFKVVYTTTELKSSIKALAGDLHLNWEKVSKTKPIIEFMGKINSLPSFGGLEDQEGNIFLSNSQWCEFYEEAKKILSNQSNEKWFGRI
jgi:hypothetical protein